MILIDFKRTFPKAAPEAEQAFSEACAEFGIDTRRRQAAFFATVAHESANLTRMDESFRYSPARLMTVWPSKFKKPADAARYSSADKLFSGKFTEDDEARIANYVYAGRMGNGPEASGDGWRFRGRGPIQLTGRLNYREFGAALKVPLEADPDLAMRFPVAARIAARFFASRGCNEAADRGDMKAVTMKVNGGLIGLADRIARYSEIFSSAPVDSGSESR